MDSNSIYTKANNLVKQCKTRDSVRIAEEIGIKLHYSDGFKDLLGMYIYQWRHRIILLNSHLGPHTQNLVTAHEIGHDKLHRGLAKTKGLMEFDLTNINNAVEYEANAFASHLLLDNDEVYSLIKQGYNLETISKMMCVNINLLMIKTQEMQKLGYNLNITNEYDRKFLNKLDMGV